jgi:hypothetical protein
LGTPPLYKETWSFDHTIFTTNTKKHGTESIHEGVGNTHRVGNTKIGKRGVD